jgi:tetratricopeptide (TPR) repeat protein
MSSFSILMVVLGVTVVVTSLSVAALRTYSERRTRRRKEEVAEQVKKYLADLRSASPPEQKRVDQDDYDVEDTRHEAGPWVKESTGESASQAHGTVGQYADQTRDTELGPWTTFHLGSIYDRQGEYARAEEAYRQVIDSEDLDAASKARLNVGVLFENRGEYARAEEAYQQAINSRHPEVAPKGTRNLRGLTMRLTARESGGARKKPWRD